MTMNFKFWIIFLVIVLGIAGCVLFLQKHQPAANTSVTLPNKILKVSVGLIQKQFSPDFYPKVSADGSKIAFWKSGYSESGAEKSEVSGLWVMNADGTGAKRIMENPVGQVTNFEWSPILDTHYNERYIFAVISRARSPLNPATLRSY